MTIVEEWEKDGIRVRVDPTCEMIVGEGLDRTGGYGRNERPCGRPATVRVSRWPEVSLFWCPEHAAMFTNWPAAPRWPGHDTWPLEWEQIDIPTFWRRGVSAAL